MSATIALPVAAPAMESDTRITVSEFYALRDRDAFTMKGVELLNGRIYFEMAETLYYNAIVQLLLDLFRVLRGEGFYAYSGPTAEVDVHNAPMPDVFINRIPPKEVALGQAGYAKDVLLVVEVSFTTGMKDRGIKAETYARAGIPEYWIVDARRRRIEVLRDPEGDEYRSVRVFSEKEFIRPLLSPEREMAVSAVFPKGSAA